MTSKRKETLGVRSMRDQITAHWQNVCGGSAGRKISVDKGDKEQSAFWN